MTNTESGLFWCIMKFHVGGGTEHEKFISTWNTYLWQVMNDTFNHTDRNDDTRSPITIFEHTFISMFISVWTILWTLKNDLKTVVLGIVLIRQK